MKRLTIRLPDDLHKQLRLLSVERGEPIQAMAVRLLTEELAREKGGKKRGGRWGGG